MAVIRPWAVAAMKCPRNWLWSRAAAASRSISTGRLPPVVLYTVTAATRESKSTIRTRLAASRRAAGADSPRRIWLAASRNSSASGFCPRSPANSIAWGRLNPARTVRASR
jgi:hypothetical protein